MGYCMFGFHAGAGGNRQGIGDYFQQLDTAGRPAVLKSVDDYGVCRELAALRQQSGVPHVIVFRRSGGAFELPNYNLSPAQAAAEHWQRIVDALPPEFVANNDKEHVWLEVINEPDKNRADWIGQFMTAIAQLALANGYKVAGPGWSTGEPEPTDWQTPGWQAYLQLCAQHPDQVAVALHEYSLDAGNILAGNGSLIGRFQQLFDVCDQANIARPCVLITEWGWVYNHVPTPELAMAHLKEAAKIYQPHPQVLGAAIWYLGHGYSDIANKAQKLIAPLTGYALSDRWDDVPPAVCSGQPRLQYARTYQILHDSLTPAQARAVFQASLGDKRTVGWSFDDAGIGDLDDRRVEIFGAPQADWQEIVDWYETHYPGVTVTFRPVPGEVGMAVTFSTSPQPSDCRGRPRVQYTRTYQLLHDSVSNDQALQVFEMGMVQRRTTGWSMDDAGIGDLTRRTIEVYGCPPAEQANFIQFYRQNYPGSVVTFKEIANLVEEFWLALPVDRALFVTSRFNDPRDYDKDGIFDDRHEGVDLAATVGGQPVNVLAAQSGIVTRVERRNTGYGHFIVIRHDWPNGQTYFTWYGHLSEIDVNVGQTVAIGQPIGVAGTTGNSTGIHLHLNLQHIGHGLPGYVEPDVVDPLPFIREGRRVGAGAIVQPVNGQALFGLHATADPRIAPGEADVFSTARVDLVKILSNLDPQSIRDLMAARPAARWIVRAFLDFGGRNISPQQFVTDTLPDTRRALDVLAGKNAVVELHNEPNLFIEGLGSTWTDGQAFAAWFLDVLNRYRAALPGVRFLYPGLSPGGTVNNVRRNATSFLEESRAAVQAADGFAAHIYWAMDYPMDTALTVLDGYLSYLSTHNMAQKLVWVTEASNNKNTVTLPAKAAEYVNFWQQLRQRPTVQGVTYFVASASNPQFADEVWVANGQSRGIAEVVGAR
ncbi:MAG: M23 family metallopeptidase [Anaerolineales bacterium]|nr:M23 family metallopeptidase [Anaerolineales bacterium]MCB8954371.1 M23 family metallopeptidase [Ardenticatenales bacterium]